MALVQKAVPNTFRAPADGLARRKARRAERLVAHRKVAKGGSAKDDAVDLDPSAFSDDETPKKAPA